MRHDIIHGRRLGDAPVPLSVLDLLPIGSGQSAPEALRASAALARYAEARGFHRFWVAEHHSQVNSASSSPAVLLAHLAAQTRTIRLGSGGVMLPNFAPLLVAEQFGTLNGLMPGRVDLGLGRAFGTSKEWAAALRRDGLPQRGNDFSEQIDELTRYLDGTASPEGHPHAGVQAVPGPFHHELPGGGPGQRPPLWILGSSPTSARLAGSRGLPYAFAAHIAPGAEESLAEYRASFTPSEWLAHPYAAVSVTAFAAERGRDALAQILTGALVHLKEADEPQTLLATPEEAENYPFSDEERLVMARYLRNEIYGTPEEVKAGIDALVSRTGADEVLIVAFTHTPEARIRSYELIADAYGLPKEEAPASR